LTLVTDIVVSEDNLVRDPLDVAKQQFKVVAGRIRFQAPWSEQSDDVI